MMRALAMRAIGWFVDWDDSLPLHALWSDLDTRHGTYWMWRWRLAAWFVCPLRGHAYYPDMCGRQEHAICERCNRTRERNAGRVVAGR